MPLRLLIIYLDLDFFCTSEVYVTINGVGIDERIFFRIAPKESTNVGFCR